MATYEQRRHKENIDISEIKKVMSIDNFLEVVEDYRDKMEELKSENDLLKQKVSEIEL